MLAFIAAPAHAQWTITFDVNQSNAEAALGATRVPAMYGALARVKTRLESMLTGSTGAVVVTLTWAPLTSAIPGAIGEAQTARVYRAVTPLAKFRLISQAEADSESVVEINLYNDLPSPSIPFYYSGTTIANTTAVEIPSALNQHLGFTAHQTANDGTITLLPPSGPRQWQFCRGPQLPMHLLFEAVVAHECLHLFGFTSNGDNLVQPTALTSWDLFRFTESIRPTLPSSITVLARELRPDVEAAWLTRLGDPAFFYMASRGTRPGGDTFQASHWRSASRLATLVPIGVMDPSTDSTTPFIGGQNRYVSRADAEALDIMGWNLDPATLSFAIADSVTPIAPVEAAVIPLGTPLTFDWQSDGGETWSLYIYQGFERVDDSPFRLYEDLPDLSYTIAATDAMPAGQYTWFVVASTFAGDAWSDYRQFTIEPSCPADFNGDGIVDPDDLADFIGCFFTTPPCPAADFNTDTVIDPDDLADYIAAHFAGC